MKRQRVGFTIVELLIVIVVIAILAAITIVAFNGIQERARVTRASSELSQLAKKITFWQVDNPNQLPTALTDMGVNNSSGTAYQYRRFDSNTAYCMSVTLDGAKSYFSNSSNPSSISSGSCTDVASVAGAPLALNSAAGTTVGFSALSGTPDVILYTVLQVNSLNDAWFNIASLQPATSDKIMQLDTGDAGSTSLRYRFDTSAAANATFSQSVRTVGRHIGWAQARGNMTVREFAYDQAASVSTSSMVPGTGWSFSQVRLGPSTSSTVPIAAVAYNATHDQQTRARVMQWLADTYNVPMTF